jgi:hypothetical protein
MILFLACIHVYAQDIPEVKVNHFNFVLEFDASVDDPNLGFPGIGFGVDKIGELDTLRKFFNSIGYEMLNDNEYSSPDHFTFLIKDRNPGDHNSIESIWFEMAGNFSGTRTSKISDHVIITIEGNKGQIYFK